MLARKLKCIDLFEFFFQIHTQQWNCWITWWFWFPGSTVVKNPPASAGDAKRCGFYSQVTKILWIRKWQPTLVFLPGKFHGQRGLVGYSPWGPKESDMTEWLSTNKVVLFLFIYHFPVWLLDIDLIVRKSIFI